MSGAFSGVEHESGLFSLTVNFPWFSGSLLNNLMDWMFGLGKNPSSGLVHAIQSAAIIDGLITGSSLYSCHVLKTNI